MKRTAIIIQTILLVTISGVSFAQDENMSGFSVPYQRGNVPVNLVTGAPSVNIPLWTVTDGNIAVPISAYYSSNGLRPSDLPDELGLQWGLNAGGGIIQIVRGLRDPFIRPIPYFIKGDIDDPSLEYMQAVYEGNSDSEPDIFKVSAPGLSIDFMSSNGDYIPMLDSDIKIETTTLTDNTFKGFKITSGNGTTYYFNVVKTSKFYEKIGTDPEKYTCSYQWLLTEIVNSDGTHRVTFNYEMNDVSDNKDLYLCYGKHLQEIDQNSHKDILMMVERTRLESIVGENETVFFNYYTPADYESPYELYVKDEYTYNRTEEFLGSIEIKNKSQEAIKTVDFEYDVNLFNRVSLNSITEKNSIGNPLPSYRFSYSGVSNFSEVFSQDIDFWGYQNEPDFLMSYIENMLPRINKNGMLNEVHYPNGGYTKYYYEPNQYRLNDIELLPLGFETWRDKLLSYGISDLDFIRGGGYRISKVDEFDGKVRTSKLFNYTFGDSISSGILTEYPIHELSYTIDIKDDGIWYYDQAINVQSKNHLGLEQGTVMYEKITVYDEGKIENPIGDDFGSNGKTEYFYNVLPAFGQDRRDPGFPYYLSLFRYDESNLLNQEIVYNNTNKILTKKVYGYNLYLDYGTLQPGLRLVGKSYNNDTEKWESFYRAWYEVFQRGIKLESINNYTYATTSSTEFINNLKTFSYSRNDIDYLYPVKISETESNGDVIETHLYYPIDSVGDNGVYDEMINRNILSPVIMKEIFKNGLRIGGEKTNYKLFTNDSNQVLIVPKNRQILEDGQYKTVETYIAYSNDGTVLSSVGIDSIYHSVILNADETEIIAVAENAKTDELFYTGFEDFTENIVNKAKTGDKAYSGSFTFDLPDKSGNYILSYWKSVNNTWEYVEEPITVTGTGNTQTINAGIIDEVRVSPADAYMGTSTYKPFVGKTSETDANNNTVSYVYDDFNRLSKVFDQDSILLKEYEYNISPFSNYNSLSQYPISSNFSGSFNSGCQLIRLTVSPDSNLLSNQENTTWQWFDDMCGGNMVKESSDLFADVKPTTKNSRYYVRPVVSGYCLPCNSYNFSPTLGELFLIGNPATSYTINEQHEPIIIELDYDACDLESPEIVINHEYKNYDWFNMQVVVGPRGKWINFLFDDELYISGTQKVCVRWYEYLFFFTRIASE